MFQNDYMFIFLLNRPDKVDFTGTSLIAEYNYPKLPIIRQFFMILSTFICLLFNIPCKALISMPSFR